MDDSNQPCKGIILPQKECKIILTLGRYYVRYETENYGYPRDGIFVNEEMFMEHRVVLDTEYYRE